MSIYIIKNDGRKEPWTPEKINRHLAKACKGLDVDIIDIIKGARLKIFNNAKSSDIQSALIKSAQEKIGTSTPDYELAAGRLLNQKLRKEVYGQFIPKNFKEEVRKRVNMGWYTTDFNKYSDDELDEFGSILDYNKDDELQYSSLSRLYNSYLIKVNGKPIETPQEVFMLIPMAVFCDLDKQTRKHYVELGYRLLRDRKISLPTPIMNGARSPFKRFVSCNLIDTGDSVESLGKATSAIMACTASKSGLGINASSIRGLGASIGKPERVKHTGILPLIKTFEAATASLTQIGRQGSCNITMPFWHYEIELFSQLGDSRGSLENRARHTDQTIIINKWFLKQALARNDIYLFHANVVPGLYEAMGYEDRFNELYNQYSKSVSNNHKKLVNAWDLLKLIISERMITGRVYLTLADNACRGAFKEDLYFTNLCCLTGDSPIKMADNTEKRIDSIKEGEKVLTYNIKTCKFEPKLVKASIKTGIKHVFEVKYNDKTLKCTSDHKFLTNRGYVEAKDLKSNDTLVEYNQNTKTLNPILVTDLGVDDVVYDIEVEDNHNFVANGFVVHNCEIILPAHSLDGSEGHPEIGCCILGNVNMGFCDFNDIPEAADFLVTFLDTMIDISEWGLPEIEYAAKNRRSLGIGISNLFGFLARNHIFYNTKTARNLVSNFTESLYYHLLKASLRLAKERGKCKLFNDTKYSEGWLTHFGDNFDFVSLSKEIKEFGLRNSTLMAIPPAASSSVVSNSTAGIEPPRELVTTKIDKFSTIKQLVPFYSECKDWYTTAWSFDFNNIDYLKLVSEIQKYVDQSISLNLYYNTLDGKIKIEDCINELIFSFNNGIKTWYYANFRTTDDVDGDKGCSSGACSV